MARYNRKAFHENSTHDCTICFLAIPNGQEQEDRDGSLYHKKCFPIKWKCYICGQLIEKSFCLISMSEETDRVFLAHTHCSKQCEEPVTIINVEKQK